MLNLHDQCEAWMPNIPNLKTYSDRSKAKAIETWKGRMVNEFASATVFEGLAQQFEHFNPHSKHIEELLSFAAEERKHGLQCASVVRALGGKAIAPAVEQPTYPLHEDVDRIEALLRNVLSVSCLSETIAVALIGAEREELPQGELKNLLTAIWADECGHANFGWRFIAEWLPHLSTAQKNNLNEYLKMAFAHLEEHEMLHLPLSKNSIVPPETVNNDHELGVCSGAAARALFYATVEGIIVPSLESLGLQAQMAWQERSYMSKNVTEE